jgi:hypothetical protein
MNAAALMQTMQNLGYITHLENGEPNPTAEAVATELTGRTLESVMLPAAIATSWAKHTPHRKTIGDPEKYMAHLENQLRAGTFRFWG